MTLEEFFEAWPESRKVFDVLHEVISHLGTVEMRVTKSQVAFARRKPFAWAWIPGKYLRVKDVPLVLSVCFHRRDESPRWKEVVPARGRFMHHLEIRSGGEIDEEVRAWLKEAWDEASHP